MRVRRSARACGGALQNRVCLSKALLRYRGQRRKERRPQSAHVKQLRSADRGQALNGRARSKSPGRVAQQRVCLTRTSEIRPGGGLRCCASHPEGSSLAQLKHPVHTVLELDSAVELGQVVVIDPQQLECEGGGGGDRKGSSGRERWESGEKKAFL